jgi:hypothetical protein
MAQAGDLGRFKGSFDVPEGRPSEVSGNWRASPRWRGIGMTRAGLSTETGDRDYLPGPLWSTSNTG